MKGVGLEEAARILEIPEESVLLAVRWGELDLTPRTRWGYRLITRASVERLAAIERRRRKCLI